MQIMASPLRPHDANGNRLDMSEDRQRLGFSRRWLRVLSSSVRAGCWNRRMPWASCRSLWRSSCEKNASMH